MRVARNFSSQHRERAPFAGLARALARRGGQRGRKSFARASMSVLRRPDDHRRIIRRRAPCAFFSADPHLDRHLMIAIAVLPASQRRSASLPAAPRSRRALPSQPPQTSSRRRAHARSSYARDPSSLSSSRDPSPRLSVISTFETPRVFAQGGFLDHRSPKERR